MNDRLQTIIDGIFAVEDITIHKQLEIDTEGIVQGGITISTLDYALQFDLTIYAPYPLQFHGHETIRFINTELIGYSHVNSDGSICVHTPHNANLKSKVYYDLQSLKDWIAKYYLKKEGDQHYDHIMVTENNSKQYNSTYLFTDIDHEFNNGDFGNIYVSQLSKGFYDKKVVLTYIVQGFKINKMPFPCKWSDKYAKLNYQRGLFAFSDLPPVHDRKFVVENWSDIEPYVTQEFLKLVYEIKKHNDFKKKGIVEFPLFIGYRIPKGIHWQCALIDINNFPIYTEKCDNSYKGHFSNTPINWALTKNCSYELFFGRGAFCANISNSQILIIGVGAIGSIVATTLARGGCRFITIADYDIKEPENVCRSEYKFSTGLDSKVLELKAALMEISPFLEVKALSEFTDAVKQFINDNQFRIPIKKTFEKYDLIIDCTADNDLAFILELLSISSDIINLSVTNHASELICAVKPNLYERLIHISSLLDKGDNDVYNPTGCWSPTFKASYNDIALMVQLALRNINLSLRDGIPLRSFYLTCDGLNIKTQQY